MIFSPPANLDEEAAAIDRIDQLRRQLKWRVAEEPRQWRGGLRRLTLAKAIQASNAIEGYNASVDDVMAVVEDEEPLDAPAQTRLALEGYRDALTYVLQLADEDDVVIDQSLLKALHYMLLKHDLRNRPGRWRAGEVFVRREPTGEIVYEGPDVSLVQPLVDEIVAGLAAPDGPVLVRAAMAHLNLVMVHPFKDGNGRMARCLQTLVLSRERILAPVLSSIEEEIGRDSDAYYGVLAEVGQGAWHPQRDARPWIRYCLNAHHRQAQRVLRRVERIEEIWHRCVRLAEQIGVPMRAVGPLCDAVGGQTIKNWSYRVAVRESEGYEIDAGTASRDLRRLVEHGLLEAQGENRGRQYRATQPLVDIRQAVNRAHQGARPVDLFAHDDTVSRAAGPSPSGGPPPAYPAPTASEPIADVTAGRGRGRGLSVVVTQEPSDG